MESAFVRDDLDHIINLATHLRDGTFHAFGADLATDLRIAQSSLRRIAEITSRLTSENWEDLLVAHVNRAVGR